MTNSKKPTAQPRRRRQSAGNPLDPHGEIVLRLQALYAEVEREPIPPDLIALLEKLDEAEEQRQP